jgi:hypothetical protein
MQKSSIILPLSIIFITSIILIYIGENIPAQATAQSNQPTSATMTLSLNLTDGSPNQYQEGSTSYMSIGSMVTNVAELNGIKAGSGYTYSSAADDTISTSFPAKVPDPQKPNRETVLYVNIRLNVNSNETKPDGLKLYCGETGFFSNEIGNYQVTEGILEQTTNSEATLSLNLEQ